MKKITSLAALVLIFSMLLTSCSIFGGSNNIQNGGEINNGDESKYSPQPFPSGAFEKTDKLGVIGSIVQTGDGNAYVSGKIPTPRAKSGDAEEPDEGTNKHLVTLEHEFGNSCYVSGYMGNSLYVIQDFGSLALNKKGVGHKDGTVLLEYGDDGYFSISSFSEDKFIVGNPTDESTNTVFGEGDSYRFGYMVYDSAAKEIKPLYEENNLRFYTAGYFIDGVALVSVKENGKILFGIIDSNGNYVVEPQYELMADEIIDGNVIVATEATPKDTEMYTTDTCGKNVGYDSTLMTSVQLARAYACESKTVGIIDTKTGGAILPCSYAYAERVIGSTYFLIDNDGNKFLFDAKTKSFTDVESGYYSYFNSEWMLFVDEDEAYFADETLMLFEVGDIAIGDRITEIKSLTERAINTNIISAVRDSQAEYMKAGGSKSELKHEIDKDTRTGHLTIIATGDVIENVSSYTEPFNGGFLYTKENSLYRYDMQTKVNIVIETGYGNYTEDYEKRGESYHTSIGKLDDGVYLLRYNTKMAYGTTYHMIIINDMGEVLFDTAINAVERLTKNYLGKYDAALYELAGGTEIGDNYFLTRDDGSHFLISFVRGESYSTDTDEENKLSHTRTVDTLDTIILLSPFTLDFADGSEISVTLEGDTVSAEHYFYDSETQKFKIFSGAFGFFVHEKMQRQGYADIVVTSGDESVTLTIQVSPFAFRF